MNALIKRIKTTMAYEIIRLRNNAIAVLEHLNLDVIRITDPMDAEGEYLLTIDNRYYVIVGVKSRSKLDSEDIMKLINREYRSLLTRKSTVDVIACC